MRRKLTKRVVFIAFVCCIALIAYLLIVQTSENYPFYDSQAYQETITAVYATNTAVMKALLGTQAEFQQRR